MNKKTRSLLVIVLLLVACLALFTSCSAEKAEVFTPENQLGGIGKLIRWMYGLTGSYGWTVVIFTVALKIFMLPLDVWQRYSAKKSSVKMQTIQPLLENIDKRYGANTQRANEEKQKLYKKQGFSAMSSCLPMIITMVVFFVMFGGLREFSLYRNVEAFNNMANSYYNSMEAQIEDSSWKDTYTATFEQAKQTLLEKNVRKAIEEEKGVEEAEKIIANKEGEDYKNYLEKAEESLTNKEILFQIQAVDAVLNQMGSSEKETFDQWHDNAEKAIQNEYKVQQDSWLWINNIAQPDTWAPIMVAYDEGSNNFSQSVKMGDFDVVGNAGNGEAVYNTVRNAVLKIDNCSYGKNGTWNGLMILPILSVALSFVSMWISQRMEKRPQNAQQASTNKTMMIMMPLMMAFFGFTYTGSFAIYMVINYLLSIISTVALRTPVDKLVEKQIAKEEVENSSKASYMR